MPDSISTNGTFADATGTGLSTLSVTPKKLGDAIFVTASYINSDTLTAVSGGGCTGWTKLVGAFGASSTAKIDLWMGTVTSSINVATNVTVTITGTSNTVRICAQEFTGDGGVGTVWTQDGAGGTKTNASSTTVTFPTLTPSGPRRLYIGYGLVANTATGGSQTSGYTLDLDPGSNPYMFNPNVSTAQTPTCTQAAGLSGAIGALVYALRPPAQFMPFF